MKSKVLIASSIIHHQHFLTKRPARHTLPQHQHRAIAQTMKLFTTAALTLLQTHSLRTVSAFSPLASSPPHSSSLNMSTTTSSQPDVSSFMTNPQPQETKDYIMQQTMMRVKDPVKSLEFYCNVLGFRLIHYSEVREMAHGTAIEYCV